MKREHAMNNRKKVYCKIRKTENINASLSTEREFQEKMCHGNKTGKENKGTVARVQKRQALNE